jgi:hypothetical protein
LISLVMSPGGGLRVLGGYVPARTFRIVAWQINEGTMTVAMSFSSGAFDFH